MHFSAWRLAAGLTFRFLIQHSADVWKMQALLEEVRKYPSSICHNIEYNIGCRWTGLCKPIEQLTSLQQDPKYFTTPTLQQDNWAWPVCFNLNSFYYSCHKLIMLQSCSPFSYCSLLDDGVWHARWAKEVSKTSIHAVLLNMKLDMLLTCEDLGHTFLQAPHLNLREPTTYASYKRGVELGGHQDNSYNSNFFLPVTHAQPLS